jgi:energy-coupling factor transport system ATP-binding protein
MTLLELQDISFQYSGIGGSNEPVLRGIHLEFFSNQCVAICGPSGSGKTTLIQLFNGLLKPRSGKVLFKGQDIWGKGFSQSLLRRSIGLVFQFPETQLFEETVFKDVAFGPKNLGLSPEEIQTSVYKALENVELDSAQFKDRSPFRLSEGEKRRVAIAGVLAMEPEMIVFDEPTAGLDTKGVRRFKAIVRRLLHQDKTVILVTHNMDFIADVAHNAVAVVDGRIVYQGQPRDLFENNDILAQAGLEPPRFLSAIKDFDIPAPFRDIRSWDEFEQKIKQESSR